MVQTFYNPTINVLSRPDQPTSNLVYLVNRSWSFGIFFHFILDFWAKNLKTTGAWALALPAGGGAIAIVLVAVLFHQTARTTATPPIR